MVPSPWRVPGKAVAILERMLPIERPVESA
jgi:hypothetical protein